METEKKYIFDDPTNVKRILYLLYGCCVFLFALDFVIHRHVVHRWENIWGFYPIYGFIGCVTLVIVAKWMRTFLMRPENYYDEDKADVNVKPDADLKQRTEAGSHDVDA